MDTLLFELNGKRHSVNLTNTSLSTLFANYNKLYIILLILDPIITPIEQWSCEMVEFLVDLVNNFKELKSMDGFIS